MKLPIDQTKIAALVTGDGGVCGVCATAALAVESASTAAPRVVFQAVIVSLL